MIVNIEAALSYDFPEATDLLLQVEVARMAGQLVEEDALLTTPVDDFVRIGGEAALGTRAWMRAGIPAARDSAISTWA